MSTALSDLPTTDSGSIRKQDAMEWMWSLDDPDEDELIGTLIPKPDGFEGSTFATPISTVRVTGRPAFIQAVAKLLQPLLVWESSATRVALNVKQVQDRETGEFTDNYALYLSAAERGREAGMMQALIGSNDGMDRRLLSALDQYGGEQ
jgi:hypothetical protein